MAGVLEQLQHQIEDLTAAISKLSDQVKGLEHSGDLTRSPNALDTKSNHCNENPVRDSGYVNWDESHDSLKNSKNMSWLDIHSLIYTYYDDESDLTIKLQEKSITINENIRFPEHNNPTKNLYVNTSHPEVICELLINNIFAKHTSTVIALVKNHVHTRSSFEEKYKLRWVDPKEQTPIVETESEKPNNEKSATESPKSSEIKEADEKIAVKEKDLQILGKVITNNVDTITNHEAIPNTNSVENCDSNQNPCSKSEMPEVNDNSKIILCEEKPATVDIMSIEPRSSQKLLDTADVLIHNTSNLIMPLNSIKDSLFKQDSSVSSTAPEDEPFEHESIPGMNSGDNCDSNQNPCSKSATPEISVITKIILTEENPATIDIMSIEPTSSQKLLDTADLLTENTDDDLIMPLNSINDSLFIQDSSVSLTTPEDEADGAEEHLSDNEITSEIKHEDEKDDKSLELSEILPEMLDIITQSKSNNLVTELSTLDLSHNELLKMVVDLFVDNYSDIIEELMKKKVNTFLQNVKTFNMTSKEHFNILIDLLCEKIAEEPDLAHHFANMCHNLSDAKEFRSVLLNKCQNDFETFVIDDNQKHDEEDHQMNRRCVGIVKFIGELYNRDNMITTKVIDYCLQKLILISTEINVECICELLNTSGRKLGRECSKELSKALKKIGDLLSSEPNSENISSRIKRMMQNTLDLSKRKWKTVPLPTTLDQFEKKCDRKRLLMNMLKDSETEDPGNTNIESAAWFDERVDRKDRVESKAENMTGNPLRFKYSVETLKLAVTNENISYIKEPPTYFENIYENYSIFEKFQADPTTQNNRIISYQETILPHVENKDSKTITQDNLSQNQYKIARHLIQGFIENSDSEKLVLDIESQIPRRNHGALMDFILDEALTSRHTTILSNAMFLLVETNIVTLDIFKAAIKEIFYTLRILYKHIPFPELFEKLACILAPHIENHNITLGDIFVMSNNIIIVSEGHNFLGTLMLTLKERMGEAFVITLWVDSKLSPVQWMFTEMVSKWVADYKLAFLNPHLCINHRPYVPSM